jgi:hypothetical protein
MKCLISYLLFGIAAATAGDFPTVMAEPNLEKRSELALKEADAAITAAKAAYEGGDIAGFKGKTGDVVDLVQLSYKSLQDTGKRARRSPKHFKRAEHRIRALMRRLDTFAVEVSVDDREPVLSARKELNEVHETVLLDIMSKK